ncbi:MAG: DUF2490 domain-containing protein, partial [Draconibacterium sp.]|nr:DUF2490 domain-containing protein [Draconibacterium sp.]
RKMPTTLSFRWYILLFPLMIFIAINGSAQSFYRVGSMPSVNINNGLPDNWALHFKTESRLLFQSGQFGKEPIRDFDYVLSDISMIVSKKTGLNTNLGGGYLVRILENQVIHRTIQQISIVRKYNSFRLAHRFSADQSFNLSPNGEFEFKYVEYRLRYRIAAEFPLNGQSVDAREFYLKINNEYLYGWQNSEDDIEIRIVPLLGYNFEDNSKLEMGLDYRLDSFLNDHTQNSFWLSINWFFRI